MRTLIFEPNPSGHRPHHVRLIADALVELGHQVEIAIGDRTPGTTVHLSELEVAFRLIGSRPSLSPWRAAGRDLRLLHNLIESLKPEHVFIPYADGLTQRGALSRMLRIRGRPERTFIEALHLRGHFAYPSAGFAQRARGWGNHRLLRHSPWDSTHLLDPLAFELLATGRSSGRSAGYDLIPEPVEQNSGESQAEARLSLGLELDAQYVGCVGRIDSRKGVDLLLEAFARGFGVNTRLLLIGEHDKAIKDKLAGFSSELAAGRIVSRDEYVSQQNLQSAIAALDVAALPYRGHAGSSGLMVRAAAARRAIVASNYGWIGECVRRFNFGYVFEPDEPGALAAAIRRALADPSGAVANERGRRFIEFNSEENFKRAWMRQITVRSGQPVEQNTSNWDWVMTGEGS